MIDAVTDPNMPPAPPHLTWEQIVNLGSSVLAGDAEALGYAKTRASAAVLSRR